MGDVLLPDDDQIKKYNKDDRNEDLLYVVVYIGLNKFITFTLKLIFFGGGKKREYVVNFPK